LLFSSSAKAQQPPIDPRCDLTVQANVEMCRGELNGRAAPGRAAEWSNLCCSSPTLRINNGTCNPTQQACTLPSSFPQACPNAIYIGPGQQMNVNVYQTCMNAIGQIAQDPNNAVVFAPLYLCSYLGALGTRLAICNYITRQNVGAGTSTTTRRGRVVTVSSFWSALGAALGCW
jgi:hypothetical protein